MTRHSFTLSVIRKAYAQMEKEHNGCLSDTTIQDFIDGWVKPIDYHNTFSIAHRSDASNQVLSSPTKKKK